MLSYMAVGLGESREMVRMRCLERMVRVEEGVGGGNVGGSDGANGGGEGSA